MQGSWYTCCSSFACVPCALKLIYISIEHHATYSSQKLRRVLCSTQAPCVLEQPLFSFAWWQRHILCVKARLLGSRSSAQIRDRPARKITLIFVDQLDVFEEHVEVPRNTLSSTNVVWMWNENRHHSRAFE